MLPPGHPAPAEPFPVFVRRGDGRPEVEGLVAALGGAAAAGLQKYFFVARADQTVVLVSSRDAALAGALRSRRGWAEPVDGS
jgi:hypothetical protein